MDDVKEDMLRPSSSRTDHDDVISMHKIELLTSESGTLVEEVREKIDLKSMLEVDGDIQVQANKRAGPDFAGTVENGLGEEVGHLQTHSMSPTGPENTPTSMVFSINGGLLQLLHEEPFSDFSFTCVGPFKKPRRQPAWLSPAIWRVILFQL